MTYYYAEIENGVVINLLESDLQIPTTSSLVQTDYNSFTGVNISKENAGLASNYCAIGYLYNADAGRFYPAQPYPSWTLNNTTYRWESPIPYPTDGQPYVWDETTQSWVVQ